MTREVKFRGKRIDNGEWVYGCYYTNIGCKNGVQRLAHFIKANDDVFEVDPDTVGQYTGRNDKRSVEIYDGDVVKSGKKSLEVFWNSIGSGGWWYAEPYDGGRKHVDRIDLRDIEVIGNIHDNPELLEVTP